MNSKDPRFWSLIGFGFGAVITPINQWATPVDSLLNGLLTSAVFYVFARYILSRNKISEVSSSESTDAKFIRPSVDGYSRVKICDQCEKQVTMEYSKCYLCGGVSFTHKFVHFTEAVSVNSANYYPEFKTCPMCALEIKFAAKKCHHCQHMMESDF